MFQHNAGAHKGVFPDFFDSAGQRCQNRRPQTAGQIYAAVETIIAKDGVMTIAKAAQYAAAVLAQAAYWW